VHRSVGAATIVSSEIVDEARVLHVGGVMLTADRDGFVCDLEIELDAVPARDDDELPEGVERLAEPVTTVIETAVARPGVVSGEWLLLRFDDRRQEGRWRQLADEPIFLRVVDDGRLLALAVRASDDPDGSAESQWLDEVEGRPEQEQGASVTV
jgi:hypothetical protein